jgi:AcrR family transcriptional regulator
VGELKDRRARKKAQTREQIRTIARELFAEHGFEAVTIADIAAKADVAVQTVFNHFPTKEELFFDGRTDWVDASAAAVRNRRPGVPPLTALREHLMTSVRDYLRVLGDPAVRCVIATLDASPALQAHELQLHQESVRRLSAALVEAFTDEEPVGGPSIDPRILGSLTAAVWMAAIRALIIEQRSELSAVVGAAEVSAAVELLAARVLEQFEGLHGTVEDALAGVVPDLDVTVRPAGVRRAG